MEQKKSDSAHKSENKLISLLNSMRAKTPGTYVSLLIVGLLGIAVLVTISQLRQTQDPRGRAAGGLPNRVAWQGRDWYLQGANVPWYNWACDFGCNQSGGVAGNKPTLQAGFQKLKDSNMHVARWWVFPGDPWQITRDSSGPTGLNPSIYADFDAALELAEQYDLYYDFVLFSAATAPPKSWLTDSNQRIKLGQALAPLFARYANNPRVMTWEIYNEPEYQIWGGEIDEASAVETAKVIANTVHANSQALVTVGQAMADGMPMWKDVALDYYSPHWYPGFSSGGFCIICETAQEKRIRFGLTDNKPIVVGEMYMGADTDTQVQLNKLYGDGYAGTWGWSLFPDRTNDQLAIDFAAVNSFTTGKTDIGPTSSGITPSITGGASVTYQTTLSGSAEVPPVTTNAAGNATIVVNGTSGSVSVSSTGLSSSVTGVHIHGSASPGANAGILFTLPTQANFTNHPITLTSAQLTQLASGQYYINVHTTNNPNGEIRGHLTTGTSSPTPTSAANTPTPTSQSNTPTPTVSPVPGSASMSFSPSTQSVGTGQTVTVQLRENSGTSPVNAAQSVVNFDSTRLTFQSISYTNSAFGTQAQETIGTSSITLVRGTTTPVTGDKLIATITFTAKTVSGAANLTFATSSLVVSSQTNQNILATRNTGTITVTSAKPGDLNNDNAVNSFDLSILLSNYSTTNAIADINNDGNVNIFDLSILLSNYGT